MELKESLGGPWKEITSFRGESRVALEVGEAVYPGKMILVAVMPSRLRADFFSPFGQIKGLAVIRGDSLLEWVPGGKSASSPLEASLVRKLAGWQDRSPAEGLTAILTGQPVGVFEEAILEWEERWEEESFPGDPSGLPTLFLRSADGEMLVTRLALRDPVTGESLRVKYGSFDNVDGYNLPGKVEILLPENRLSLMIKYRHVELNPEIEDGLFTLPPP
jgi:hypothetical protein